MGHVPDLAFVALTVVVFTVLALLVSGLERLGSSGDPR
jgi:hypothetical protein